MKPLSFLAIIILFFSCGSDDSSDIQPTATDPIIGTWTELGAGTVLEDGTDEFSEYTYFCVTLGRFSFEVDGNFRIETFDGPDDNCSSTGILLGTWENDGDSYLFNIISDTASEPESGQATIKIQFPNVDQMEWIFASTSDNVDYSYERYERVE